MGILTGLTPAKVSLLSPAQIKSLGASDIATMTALQLAGLTASQLALFSPAQLAGLSKTQIGALTVAAIGGLTPAQIAALTAAQVSGFTGAQISALSLAQFGGLSAADIAALSTTQVAALTTAQVAALKTTQFAALSAADLTALSIAQIKALTKAEIAALTTAQLSGLSAADIAALSAGQIAGLSAPDMAALTGAQVKGLTGAQVASLTIAQLGALSAAQIGFFTPTAVAGFTAAQIAALTKTQLAGLMAAQVAALTTAQLGTLSAAQIGVLSTAALAGLTTAQIAALTTAQLAGLSATQFGALSGAQIGALTTADIHALSTARVASLTAPQIAGLTAGQIGAFSAAQLAGLNINYDTMLAILQADAAGGMTAGEFSALQALVGKFNVPGGISVSGYVQQITGDVVLGNAANATWMGGTSHATALGNLSAASSQTQAGELIGKWFLGTDLPSNTVTMSGVPTFTVSYSAVASPLFGSGGPSMWDINQGFLGDCFVLAPLAEMAAQDPSAIQSMITPNGNNTFSVRFSVAGKDNYVTVDNRLADGGGIFNYGTNDWASLIEKAYTQLQAGGALTGDRFTFGNSYSSIGNGGYAEATLEELTGAATITDFVSTGSSWTSYTYDGASLAVPDSPGSVTLTSSKSGLSGGAVQAVLVADLSAGDDLILSSYTDAADTNGKTTLVADHAMAVYGFDTTTGMFKVYNPWGTRSGGGQHWDTTFEVGLDSLLANRDAISVATNQPPMAGGAAPLLPGPAHQLGDMLGLAAPVG